MQKNYIKIFSYLFIILCSFIVFLSLIKLMIPSLFEYTIFEIPIIYVLISFTVIAVIRALIKKVSPSSPASQEPKIIYRFPHVLLQDKIALDELCTIKVKVTQKPTRKQYEKYRMTFAIPPAAESTNVDVLVIAQDFEIIGDNVRSLIVYSNKDSETILFQMKPKSLGEKKVKVEFFQDSKYVGGITTTTSVVMPTELIKLKQVSTSGIIGFEKQTLPPDLIMLITESQSENHKMSYKFKLHSPQNGLFYYTIQQELSFLGSPSKWIENLYQELSIIAAKSNHDDIIETLSAIGSDLYEKLFPFELKQIWQEHIKGKVNSIMIISDEPWIPWELIRPFYETATGEIVEDHFLCENYLFARWLPGWPPQSCIKISQGAVIAPISSNLPNVIREINFIKSLGNIKEIEPRLKKVRKLLKFGSFQLIHFACHGSFNPEDHEQSAVYLQDNDKLMSRDISGERKNFGKDRPFVFINACQTARADFSLVGIGSWAYKFINAKSSGFLGSLWEVNDELAYRFCNKFYSALLEGNTVGEAILKARLDIRSESDPTWLAYTLYADPMAKIIFV